MRTSKFSSASGDIIGADLVPALFLPLFPGACRLFTQDIYALSVIARCSYEELVRTIERAHRVGGIIPTGEHITVQRKGDGLLFFGAKTDTPESSQTFDRAVRVGNAFGIELDGFSTTPLSRVADSDTDAVVAVYRLADLEGSVAQSISEGKQWLSFEVTIGTSLHTIVGEVG